MESPPRGVHSQESMVSLELFHIPEIVPLRHWSPGSARQLMQACAASVLLSKPAIYSRFGSPESCEQSCALEFYTLLKKPAMASTCPSECIIANSELTDPGNQEVARVIMGPASISLLAKKTRHAVPEKLLQFTVHPLHAVAP